MGDEGLEHSADEPPILYMYRQTARQAGVGMMIGPPLLAAGAIWFAWSFFWPREVIWDVWEIGTAAFVCVFCCGFAALACLFFIFGIRRVLFGGAWRCVIDRDILTWCYPARISFQDQSVALRDIRGVQIVAPEWTDADFQEFIITDTEKLAIHAECYGRLVPFLRALLRANPAIDVEIVEPGGVHLWPPTRRQIEALCAEAKRRRAAPDQSAM